VKELRDRFPARELFNALHIFSPAAFPDPKAGDELRDFSQSYGVVELNKLLKHFGKQKKGRDDVVFPPLVDMEEACTEWAELKHVLLTFKGREPTPTMAGVLKILSTEEPYKDSYSNLLLLLEIAIVQPLNTAACERGFSIQNVIKTRNRSRLTIGSLDALMRIRLYGPSPTDMVYKDSIRRWRKGVKTNRRPLFKASTLVIGSESEVSEPENDN
jgi:hypothetical protein